MKNPKPITYDKISVPKQKLNYTQMIKADNRGFNAKIGSITNHSSCMFSMLNLFKDGDERKEILKKRIRILRKLIGNSIDAAKGVKYIPMPKEWTKRQPVLETDTEEEKARKNWYNSLIVSKKPYFMTGIYNELKETNEKYKKTYNYLSHYQFNMGIRSLINKKNKTDEEIKFLMTYNNYSPVLNTNSIMNVLCRKVEDTDFNLKYFKQKTNFDYHIYLTLKDFSVEVYREVERVLLNHSRAYSKAVQNYRSDSNIKESGFETNRLIKNLYAQCEIDLLQILNNKRILANYVTDIAYKKNNVTYKNLLWALFGKELVKNIGKEVRSIEVPVLTEDGEEIFGGRFSLLSLFDTDKDKEVAADNGGNEDWLEEIENWLEEEES